MPELQQAMSTLDSIEQAILTKFQIMLSHHFIPAVLSMAYLHYMKNSPFIQDSCEYQSVEPPSIKPLWIGLFQTMLKSNDFLKY